jgi:small subunit ribosomal protein S8
MQDTTADMLVQIKNAQAVKKSSIDLNNSRLKTAIAEVLKQEGYITDYNCYEYDKKPRMQLYLKYYNNEPVIDRLDRVSKPSRRVYKSKDELPRVENGMGIAIISTSYGVMSDHKARQHGCGGEIICYVS